MGKQVARFVEKNFPSKPKFIDIDDCEYDCDCDCDCIFITYIQMNEWKIIY